MASMSHDEIVPSLIPPASSSTLTLAHTGPLLSNEWNTPMASSL